MTKISKESILAELHQVGFTRSGVIFYSTVAVGLFFILPFLVTLGIAGVLVWALCCIVVGIGFIRTQSSFSYQLTEERLVKVWMHSGIIVWQIALRDIQQMRVLSDKIVIYIPKKIRVVYTSSSDPFTAHLLQQHRIFFEAE